jgi:hypothetical protein
MKDENKCCISDGGYMYVQNVTVLVQQDAKVEHQ